MQKKTSATPLNYYIDQLAEYIVLDANVNMCGLCIRGSCNSQQSGLTCRYGVKAFLQNKAGEFADVLKMDLQHNRAYYEFLDTRSGGEPIDAARDALLTCFGELTDFRASAIVLTHHMLKEAS